MSPLELRIGELLQADQTCQGKVRYSTVSAIALLLQPAPAPTEPGEALADVIAFLEQRVDNCDEMAKRDFETAEYARDRKRQLEVVIDEFKAGRHRGSAEVRAHLKQPAPADAGATLP